MIWKRRKDNRVDRDERRHTRREDKTNLWNARAGCFKWLAICVAGAVALAYGVRAGALQSLLTMFGK